jgi:hypothetical protein
MGVSPGVTGIEGPKKQNQGPMPLIFLPSTMIEWVGGGALCNPELCVGQWALHLSGLPRGPDPPNPLPCPHIHLHGAGDRQSLGPALLRSLVPPASSVSLSVVSRPCPRMRNKPLHPTWTSDCAGALVGSCFALCYKWLLGCSFLIIREKSCQWVFQISPPEGKAEVGLWHFVGKQV